MKSDNPYQPPAADFDDARHASAVHTYVQTPEVKSQPTHLWVRMVAGLLGGAMTITGAASLYFSPVTPYYIIFMVVLIYAGTKLTVASIADRLFTFRKLL